MTRLYTDCEFNGHLGQLISLAIADVHGEHWYGIMPLPTAIDPWVKDNVIPQLLKIPNVAAHYVAGHLSTDGDQQFRASLRAYLQPRAGSIVYADWPGDLKHLLEVMEGRRYGEQFEIELRLHYIPCSDCKPAIPHNALSDALALMDWHTRTVA